MRPARVRSLVPVLLVLLAPAAHAGPGVNIRWDHCLGDAGVPNKNFACDTNDGNETLVCSFELASDIAQVSGQEFAIDVFSVSPTLPAWWTFRNPGTCRELALAMNATDSPTAVNCPDWADGAAFGGLGAFDIGARGPNTARIHAASAMPMGIFASLVAGTEYFSASFTISNIKTVGTGACDGCIVPVCIVFAGENVTAPVAGDDVVLTGPTNFADSNIATWLGGGPVGGQTACPRPVPTRRSTFGAVKALYR